MRIRKVTLLVLTAMIVFLASGCGSKTESEPDPESEETIQTEQSTDEMTAPSGNDVQPATDTDSADAGEPESDESPADDQDQADQGSKEDQDDSGKLELEISSTDEAPAPAESGGAEKDGQEIQLRLMNITLEDNRETVISKHGQPLETYVMEDEADPVSVYQYADFSVGFNQEGRVEFVDVSSPDADPGLNGVKPGTSVDECLALLGKPAVQTEYVLNYMTDTAVLKMDIDPVDQVIISIKLFAN